MFLKETPIEVLLEKIQTYSNRYTNAFDGWIRTCIANDISAVDVVWAHDERRGIPQEESKTGVSSDSSDSFQQSGSSLASKESWDEGNNI